MILIQMMNFNQTMNIIKISTKNILFKDKIKIKKSKVKWK